MTNHLTNASKYIYVWFMCNCVFYVSASISMFRSCFGTKKNERCLNWAVKLWGDVIFCVNTTQVWVRKCLEVLHVVSFSVFTNCLVRLKSKFSEYLFAQNPAVCQSGQVTLAIADITRLGSPNETSYLNEYAQLAQMRWYIRISLKYHIYCMTLNNLIRDPQP